jgi:hypothetical protein
MLIYVSELMIDSMMQACRLAPTVLPERSCGPQATRTGRVILVFSGGKRMLDFRCLSFRPWPEAHDQRSFVPYPQPPLYSNQWYRASGRPQRL